MKIHENLNQVTEYMEKTLKISENFDLIYRVLEIHGNRAAIYCVDGFTKDEVLQKLLDSIYGRLKEELPKDARMFSKTLIPYNEVDLIQEYEPAITALLSGQTLLFIEGYTTVLVIDCRTYPARGVKEPDKDKTLRGSRDGFVETLVMNTALVRRRIRDPELRMEWMSVGSSSKTDICLCFMEDRANPKLISNVRTRIQNLEVDALTMNQESLAECIYQGKWLNPFPKFKFTERPDTAAASVLEGSLVIFVDTSPSAMILPSSVFDIIEEADDYYFPPVTGTYLRLSRFLILIATFLLTPVWLLLVQNPQWIPESLLFILPKETVYVPFILQFLMLELAVDGLRLAAVNTPSMLSMPLSVLAAIVVGDYAVQSGWFNAEPLLYMAFVALANYTQSSFELGYAVKFMRIITLVLTALFQQWGFFAGVLFSIVVIAANKTVSGDSYLAPLIPFQWKSFCRRFFRMRISHGEKSEKS